MDPVAPFPNAKRMLNTQVRPISTLVGSASDESATVFYIHEDLLKEHSRFFQVALDKDWKEAQERIVRLPEESPKTFAIFACFVYYGHVATGFSEGDLRNTDEGAENEAGREERINQVNAALNSARDCWLLGDKLMSSTFKDASIDEYINIMKVSNRHPVVAHETVYANTSGPSTMRRLLVDVAVWDWSNKQYEDKAVAVEWMEFFRDLAKRCHEVSETQRKKTAPYYKGDCGYHEHGDEPCYKTMFH